MIGLKINKPLENYDEYTAASKWCNENGAAIIEYDDFYMIEAIPPPSLDQIKKTMWDLIQAERDRRKAGGVKVQGCWIHSDDTSRIQHMALFMKGGSIPAGLWWKTMSGEFVMMTPELATDIFNAIVDSDQQIFAIAEQHKAAMQMSDDPAEYDFSHGWPETYGEIQS